VVLYREVLDAWQPDRTAPALRGVSRALAARARRVEGISPHASHTASQGLLEGVASLVRRRRLPVTVHWSETPEEVEWLRSGTGAWAALLGPSPHRSGLDLLEAAGLLGPGTSLVHGNCPLRGEPDRLAARGAVLVHCPGTHAFFERAPFPWRRYRRAGVRLALGTDSRASNADLDMRREMALARRAAPWLDPVEVLAMATEQAARALGLGDRVGCLAPGFAADWVLYEADPGAGRVSFLEQLTAGATAVRDVAVAGRSVRRGLLDAETRPPMV
jgi:cytosine/adenosine deaminase-related metal-dependent hydrolase